LDRLQFIASVTASTAWPLATIAVVWLLRRAFTDLIPRLRRLKVSGIDAEFSEKLAKAEAEVAELPNISSLGTVQSKKLMIDDKTKADFSNNSAIFVAWLHVESAILNLARSRNLLEPNMPEFQASLRLRENNVIDNSIYRAIIELRELRSLAVHPDAVTRISDEQLERFKVLAERVTGALEGITRT